MRFEQAMTSKNFASVCGIILVLLVGVIGGQAQGKPNRGFQPAGSYAITDLETINTTNGNLMYNIPLGSLPGGRGGNPGFKLGLLYNSKLWDSQQHIHTALAGNPPADYTLNLLSASADGGWRYGVGFSYEVLNRLDEYDVASTPQCFQDSNLVNYQWKLRVKFPDGSSHEFRPYGNYQSYFNDGYFNVRADGYVSNCAGTGFYIQTGMNFYSTDGSFIRLFVEFDGDGNWGNNPFTLHFPNGVRVVQGTSAQRIFDRNGNFVKITNTTYNGHEAKLIEDELNRRVIIEHTDFNPTTQRVVDYIHMWGVNNQQVTWAVTWKEVWVYKTYTPTLDTGYIDGPKELFTSMLVVERIDLPVQAGSLNYTFGYHASDVRPTSSNYTTGWGDINSLTLPTGASAAYQHQLDGQNLIFWSDVLKNHPVRKDLTYLLEYDNTSAQTTERWDYAISATGSSITRPDGGATSQSFNNTDNNTWDSGLAYKTVAPDGTVVERVWARNGSLNPYVKTEFTSIPDAAGIITNGKTAIKDYSYDRNGNLTRVAEYDWVAYGSVPRTNGKPTGLPSGVQPVRVTVNKYYNPTPDASDPTDDPDIYYRPESPRFKNALKSAEVQNGSGVVLARTEYTYDDPSITANLTLQKSWDSTKGAVSDPLTSSNSISVSHQYDSYGNPTFSTDARGIQSQFIYDTDSLYVTETRAAINTPVQRTTLQQHDSYTGLVTLVTDVDNSVSTRTTYDALGRVTLVQEAEGKSQERRTRTEYSDAARRVVVWSDLDSMGDENLVSIQHYDQMGRVRLSRQLEDKATQSPYNESHGIKVQTRYRSTSPNSYELVSNPYRAATSSAAGGEQTMGWTRSKSDKGGRVIEVQTFQGAGLPAPWGSNSSSTGAVTTAYELNYTTVTDQAGKARRSKVDGLGRLIRVDEPQTTGTNLGGLETPLQPTKYTYDVLGNLTEVDQGGQKRSFFYTSLSRLRKSTNPESGSIDYEYDANGNLKKRTDARSIVTNYAYDELNRVVNRTYSDSTPPVFYYYDNQALPVGAPPISRGSSYGRLVATTYGSATNSAGTYLGYDVLGQVVASAQETDNQEYSFTYEYDWAGNLKKQVYPSGKAVVTEYDVAGRIAGVRKEGSSYYAGAARTDSTNRLQYTAHGAVSAMRLGNLKWESTSFNSRLQPTSISVGTSSTDTSLLRLAYTYATATTNNGNITRQTITVGATSIQQDYTYDELNRLRTAQEGVAWARRFDYDRWGNRTAVWNGVSGGSLIQSVTLQQQAGAPTNRMESIDGVSCAYDAAGNMTGGGGSYQYDGENRLTSYNQGAGLYSYDGDGRRIKKQESSDTTVYVYNAAGQLIAEYSTAGPANNGTSYIAQDHLGSTRLVMKGDGTLSRHDYLPFGEEIAGTTGARGGIGGYGAADSVKQKFTGYERDQESGLDFAQARYYSSAQGRFTSVDPENAGASVEEPQSWNGYSYAINNPLMYVDPDGMKFIVWDAAGKSYTLWDYEARRGIVNDEWLAKMGYRRVRTNAWDEWASGVIYDQNGNIVGSYLRISWDDQSSRSNGVFSRLGNYGPAMKQFVDYGITINSFLISGAASVARGGIVSLGIASGPRVLAMMGAKDAAIFGMAIERGASATGNFMRNLELLTEATMELVPGGKVEKIGEINGSYVLGSGKTRYGIVLRNGITYIARALRGRPVKILGKLEK
jgi:RHS repeat-associated protein